jgi:glycosyltransferase involved in cell wall biosynthesis
VAHVVFELDGGGMESIVAAMAERFAGTAVVMSVINLSGRVGRVGAAIRGCLDQYHVVRPVRGLSMVFPIELARRIRHTRAEVVHVHSGCWYKGSLAARKAGVQRVIFTEHGREFHDPFLGRWLDRRASQRTDSVVAVSEKLGRYLSTVVGVDPARVCMIENGVDTVGFTPGAPPDGLWEMLGIPRGAPVIGSIGRLEPVKGFDRLIDAFARLRSVEAVGPKPFLVICGEGGQRTALEAQVDRLGMADVVRLPGWTDKPADFYRLLDVFALTSHSEGTPLSLLEAMACGVTPVVTDVGANAEILGSDLAQQVMPTGDLTAFVRTLALSLGSAAQRNGVGDLARRRAVERYSLDRMIAEYECLYRGLPLAGPKQAMAS